MIPFLIFFLIVMPLASEDMEPDEPEIVLPEVILQIEDLSVDTVEAGLPAEEELTAYPPVREIPMPEEEELTIEEPTHLLDLSEVEPYLEAERGYSLTAEVVLGAGIINHIVGMVSLYRVGEEPRFKLKFLHEMLDGWADKPPGSGFNLREDSLQGGVKFHLAKLGVNANGELKDLEQGLQGQGPFVSRVFRHGKAELDLQYPFNEMLSLTGRVETGFSSQLLTGPDPQPPSTEILVAPELLGELRFENIWFGLKSRYKYRTMLVGEAANQLHRLAVKALFGAELGSSLRLEGTGGWFWSTAGGSLFPFELNFSGNPFSSFTFRASGGYQVNEFDYQNLLNDYPLVELPDELHDNHGWFGDLNLSFSFLRDLSFQSRAVLFFNSLMPDPVRDPGTDTGLSEAGLFPFEQREGIQLTTDFGLRWNLGNLVTLSAGLESYFIDRPGFTPGHSFRLESEVAGASGNWGGKASFLFRFSHTEFPDLDYSLIPILDLDAYYKITESITLIGEGKDLFYHFIGGPRYPWGPFEEPGWRATLKIKITF